MADGFAQANSSQNDWSWLKNGVIQMFYEFLVERSSNGQVSHINIIIL